MLRVVDRWLEMGVDGVRLDAVPYLFEREGTNCENLPETHDYLKQLRAHVDALFPGRMLLAEANQWPEDAVAYFGDPDKGGDECHMAFHFPVMPRLFMALRMEDRYPIIDILQDTPAIPENCQWANFLRNHDELTLEMVTDEERDYMYRSYAADPQMRVNVGIRRRLAPLLRQRPAQDRADERACCSRCRARPSSTTATSSGMGDNVYLGDRDSVRTPMQWSPDRNAGFSRTNPQQLYLPVIIDPDYHYEAVNVEAQDRNPCSLLWWMRRHHRPAPAAPRVRAGRDRVPATPRTPRCWRSCAAHDDGRGRCSSSPTCRASPRASTLDLHDHRGYTPVELFGGNEFPVDRREPVPR